MHCVVTSPPYWGLRDYGVSGAIGLEATLEEWVAELVGVFREVRRVLRDDGTCWVNVGDSYADGNQGGEWKPEHKGVSGGGLSSWQNRKQRANGIRIAAKPKDLMLMPARLALALQADGWWLRSDIIWHKPNPMPESVTDRPTSSYEHVFLLSKSARYFYDADAVREEVTGNAHPQGHGNGIKFNTSFGLAIHNATAADMPTSRNMRNVWTIPTAPFPEAHFATYPPALVERCIKAGCPRGGTVLDPFAGAGTTLLVADRLQRDAIGIELNASYNDMASQRVTNDCPLFAEVVAA